MTTRSAIALIALLASAAATAAAPAPERTLLAEPPRAIADFQLTDQAGKTVKLADLRGAPVLMFFGFTHCAQICPTALHQLRQLEREHRAELGKTRIVIVSVDGERDSPAAMKTWLQPISTSFIGLTGPPARVHDIAAQFSAAFYKTPGASAGEYSMEHNSQIFLLDAKGQLRATFFNAPLATMAAVTRDVASGS
ncbi:MAG TPA: SCO family protein [Steroidobacteraceae bacterium]|jgi:protein SCO1|nr:SCO family protein [Steroidobacteraceae bacterium]